MPGPPLPEFPHDDTLPSRVDVVVIGGGVIGSCTALELTERGLKVALCEKGRIAGEQSSRNWGWVRLSKRDPREVPLMVESIRLWDGLARRTNADVGYVRCGTAFFCDTDEILDSYTHWVDNIDGYQIDAGMVGPDEIAERFPDLEKKYKGALVSSFDGKAEPQKAGPAIAAAARAKGAKILTDCAVRTIENEGGKVSGVVTERGAIACDAVVVAGGAWTRKLLWNEGHDLPQLTVTNSVMRTAPLDGPSGSFADGTYAVRKRDDGGYTISSLAANAFDLTIDTLRLMRQFLPALAMQWRNLRPEFKPTVSRATRPGRSWTSKDVSPFEHARVLDPKPSEADLTRIMRKLTAAYPEFGKAKIVQKWAGTIDVTPDAVPVMSEVDGRPGLFVATGFSGHGFGISPGAGKLMADIVTGADPLVDPTPFRWTRFHDGTRPKPMAGV
ncbi:MAG: FAD-binding oxidoreductase [Pseudomonadota bacterium]